ncbi:uncharacterized protein LTR77_007606 [Saxophila tyrrhenica]|uniref:Beta-lactamase-related domain-containing protein n=1 Tax=Saxophila tyrrhenica TaxID=1690608 RepID=A0AAV9P2I1_9PEZI|nr:hypothetical protein LTR77_007606 [Saxophila tyrrhenica]
MRKTAFLLASLISSTLSTCFDPSPAFPVPQWHNGAKDKHLASAFNSLRTKLDTFISNPKYSAASFSIELTSQTSSLFSHFHTAPERNATRPGTPKVDGDSLYRIASITKTFTTLGLLYQAEAGTLNLDDPVSDYIPELTGQIPFHDITLRALASQLSGIPRDFAQSDILLEIPDPTFIGLPPADKKNLIRCDEYADYDPPCNATDLVKWLNHHAPLFAPNAESTYSNLNFELLGLVLERVTNMTYEEYMQTSIFTPLKMSLTTISTPNDTHAVLPVGDNYWDVDEGIQNPTGAIYSSTTDMSTYLRYILTHYNALATGINWFQPASFATGLGSFYGMPWEIFRTDRILPESRRPVTFVTKSGGLPGYVSRVSLMPEYGLGVTILVACNEHCGEVLDRLQEVVTVEVVRAAEESVWEGLGVGYDGVYEAVDRELNSSIELVSSSGTGIVMNSFVSNGTDVLAEVVPKFWADPRKSWRLQLVPTLLYKDEKEQAGEIWRILAMYERKEGKGRDVWDDFCITDIDTAKYAGLPVNEVVFWHEEGVMELPAWKVTMKQSTEPKNDERFVVQQ